MVVSVSKLSWTNKKMQQPTVHADYCAVIVTFTGGGNMFAL